MLFQQLSRLHVLSLMLSSALLSTRVSAARHLANSNRNSNHLPIPSWTSTRMPRGDRRVHPFVRNIRGGATPGLASSTLSPIEAANVTTADAISSSSFSTTTTTPKINTNTNTTSVATSIPQWKQALPHPLCTKGPKTLRKLLLGGVEIYLLGTAHVSNDSASDVLLLLNATNPDAIFVELCEARIPLLEGAPTVQPQSTATATNETTTTTAKSDLKFWDKLRATQQEQGGSTMQALSSVLLTSVQEDYADELGVELGGEFRAAYRYWQQQQSPAKPHLILGDRPLHLTLVRAWESLWWWPKIKVIAGLCWSALQKPNKAELLEFLAAVQREESDVLTESLGELRHHFPTLYDSIITERDAFMAAKLVQTCRALATSQAASTAPGEKQVMVVIVGAGHVPGIFQWLTNSTSLETPEQILSRLVTTRKFAKDDASNQVLPTWINEVTELQDAPDSAWTYAQQQSTLGSTPNNAGDRTS